MPKATCPNCKRQLGCTCKLRRATNGAQCCNACVGTYNKNLTVKPSGSRVLTRSNSPK